MLEICCVMVTYNPPRETIENIRKLLLQIEKVVIVDNGSSNYIIDEIKNIFESESRVDLIFNGENLGVATALNIGARYAIDLEYLWIATFDQDSSPGQHYFDDMFDAYNLFLDRNLVRIIAPTYKNQSNSRITSSDGILTSRLLKSSNNTYRTVEFSITSGNIIDVRLFSEIGFFEDKLFIDQVDHDFCLRCINKGYLIIEASKVVLGHNLGDQTLHKFLNRNPVATNHSPLRRYYISRNRFYMYNKYITTNTKWVTTDIMRFIKDNIVIILFEENRREKLIMTIRGIRDYATNRFGRYDA